LLALECFDGNFDNIRIPHNPFTCELTDEPPKVIDATYTTLRDAIYGKLK